MEFTLGVQPELRISPADVGRRVSVRSDLGEGTPGGRFSDTVGVLTTWTGNEVRVTRRDGTPVLLAADRLVAGKVVPDAPARRRGTPSAGVGELVTVAARGWPAAEEATVGGWVCRAADGWTGRANCAIPRFTGPVPPEPDLAAITAWYTARGQSPLMQVTTGAAGTQEQLAAELDRRGWEVAGPALMQVARLAPLADREPDRRVVVGRELNDTWLRGYANADRNPAAARRLLASGPSVWFATVTAAAADGDGDGDAVPAEGGAGEARPERDHRPAAVGRCVVDGRWAGFAAVGVAPEYRRRGLARAVLAELARAALTDGADAAYLQVEEDNAPANTLYAQLGFTVHHHYHYRRAPS